MQDRLVCRIHGPTGASCTWRFVEKYLNNIDINSWWLIVDTNRPYLWYYNFLIMSADFLLALILFLAPTAFTDCWLGCRRHTLFLCIALLLLSISLVLLLHSYRYIIMALLAKNLWRIGRVFVNMTCRQTALKQNVFKWISRWSSFCDFISSACPQKHH